MPEYGGLVDVDAYDAGVVWYPGICDIPAAPEATDAFGV